MQFAWAVFMLVLLLASTMNASRRDGRRKWSYDFGTNKCTCTPCKEYQLRFNERTITDYAILENSIEYDLNAATVCFFAKDTDTSINKPACTHVYSYAVTGEDDELQICTYPVLLARVDNIGRSTDVGLDHDTWNHICFTWSSSNGDYRFYKDGMLVGSGSGMARGHKINSGGTTVIRQEQDRVGGGFDARQAFVGDVTEVNVWGVDLSKSDILAQYHNCHITIGSVTKWRDFEDGVHGETEVIPPSCAC